MTSFCLGTPGAQTSGGAAIVVHEVHLRGHHVGAERPVHEAVEREGLVLFLPVDPGAEREDLLGAAVGAAIEERALGIEHVVLHARRHTHRGL